MKTKFVALAGAVLAGLQCTGAEISTFHAYIDSDLCARLMLGPITNSRVQCAMQTFNEGSSPVIVRLNDNIVLTANKEKLLKGHVGKFAEVSGEAKLQGGTIKLQSVKGEEASAIPQGDPGRKLMDARTYKNPASAKTMEKVRHELAMMPYLGQFDFISYSMVDDHVILSGWTVRQTNRSEAFNRVKSIEGVGSVTNNIEVLPLGSSDMQIRAGTRAALQRYLSRYFWGSGSDIKIIVKNGNVILLGAVASKADYDLATIQCNSVPFVFHVFNMLRVQSPQKA
jgi:osmotically-inducible protein OsmY